MPRYNPTFLAKIVTTLDVISKGRTILGVGAGHYKPEFEINDFPCMQGNDDGLCVSFQECARA